jgi:Raf kinase inhibitor-like YbhB/YbcL family protein
MVLLLSCAQLASAASPAANSSQGGSMFAITTKAFPAGGKIPKQYTCDGQDLSPELTWSNPPAGTQSFALIMDDPDAPSGTFTHWIVWDIPPSTTALPEGTAKEQSLSDGTRQGQNSAKKIGYKGPCPPPGKPHRYFFRLFALDTKVELKAGGSRSELEGAMQGHTLAHAEVMGTYGR